MLALLLTMAMAGSAAAQSTVVILVRHAEDAPPPTADPQLTAVGRARADSLAHALRAAGVSAVYATQYARTRDTAEPLAAAIGVPVRILSVSSATIRQHIRETVETVRREHAGQTVAIVGHSNTVPMLIQAFGGAEVTPIPEGEHNGFYVLILDGERVRTIVARYGS